jgi:hypothetical protein
MRTLSMLAASAVLTLGTAASAAPAMAPLKIANYLSTTLRRVDGYGEPARVNKEGT